MTPEQEQDIKDAVELNRKMGTDAFILAALAYPSVKPGEVLVNYRQAVAEQKNDSRKGD